MTAELRLQWLAIALIGGWLMFLLGPMLTPFVAAALLAYLCDPLADQLERRGLSRQNAVIVVFITLTLLLGALLLFLVPLLERQIGNLVNSLPRYITWVQHTAVPWLIAKLGLDPSLNEPGQMADQIAAVLKDHWQTAGGVATTVVASVILLAGKKCK